jgi:hypothetical protein
VRVLLQAFARDPAPAVRAEAALSLATIPTPVLLDALRDVDAFVAHLRREMCDGDDVIARRAAIHLAGTFATVAPALAETLLDMVDVPHSPPKRGGQGPTRARWHCDRQCVPAALEALRSFPDAVYAAWPVVLDRLSDVSPEVSGAARSLLTALVDRAPDPLPRDAARAVCRRYPDLQGAGGVARQLAAHAVLYREPSFAAWMTVAALRFRDVSLVALPHLPTDHVRDLLLDASDKSVTWFAELLERVADTERPGVVTRDGILRWASHEDQRVRLAVIRLLTSLGDAEEDAPVLESEPTIAEDAGPLRLDRD